MKHESEPIATVTTFCIDCGHPTSFEWLGDAEYRCEVCALAYDQENEEL